MSKKYFILFYFPLFFCFGVCKAQYNILYNFNDTVNANPGGTLLLSNGLLYGASYIYSGSGTIYSIKPDGTGFTNLLTFNGTNGYSPTESLTPSVTGDTLFGMTEQGGSDYAYPFPGYGCVFSIQSNGTGYNQLLYFNITNGKTPEGSLTLSGNALYAMTVYGGANNKGLIFSIHTDGTGYKDLLDFDSINGETPEGSLTLSVTGDTLFGMATGGGANNHGCIFCIDTNGTGYKDLFDFSLSNSNGGDPFGSLILSGNILYGMTHGQDTMYGCAFSIKTNGTGYKDLLDFNGTTGGANPYGSLIINQGVLYGMTYEGGANHVGIIFSIDTNGSGYRDLFDFKSDSGETPGGSLTFSITGDTLFGVASDGPKGYGVIFAYHTLNYTGIDEISKNTDAVKLFPNPNNGVFQLKITNYELRIKNADVTIYNALGEKIYSTILQPNPKGALNEINLKGQPTGLYLYRVVAEKGELIGNGKFIIE